MLVYTKFILGSWIVNILQVEGYDILSSCIILLTEGRIKVGRGGEVFTRTRNIKVINNYWK